MFLKLVVTQVRPAYLYFLSLAAALTVISFCCVCSWMRSNIAHNSNFSYSFEVFNSPKTNGEYRGHNEG